VQVCRRKPFAHTPLSSGGGGLGGVGSRHGPVGKPPSHRTHPELPRPGTRELIGGFMLRAVMLLTLPLSCFLCVGAVGVLQCAAWPPGPCLTTAGGGSKKGGET
jgi:hypothetical protein